MIKTTSSLKNKKIIPFSIVWIFFSLALFWVHYDGEVNKINSTMLAFNYKYGFISRGLIGSIYKVLDYINPANMWSYEWNKIFTMTITMIYFIILFAFFMLCLKRCKITISEEIKYIIIFFTIWAIPMFVSKYNFGRLDIYCVMLSLLGAIVLIVEKWEWLVVPFSALGVMVHQGNVFMFLNIILLLLVYKALSNEGKKRKKYIVLFILSFLVASALFLYFEFFSHVNGEEIVDEVRSVAASLRYDNKYHKDVIKHEILGIDVSESERDYHLANFVQFPIFVLLMMPHIVIGVMLFRNIIKRAESPIDKFKYFMVSIGSATILPDLILKCDYGRWMFAIIAYYAVVILALLAMKDEIVTSELKSLMAKVDNKIPGAIVLLIYPMLFQPLQDVTICSLVAEWASKINETFLHWW